MRTRLVSMSTVTSSIPGSPARSPSMLVLHFSQEMSGAVSSMVAGFICWLLPWRVPVASAWLRRGAVRRRECFPARLAEAAQPQRVADHRDRAGGHRDGGEYGRQDAGGGQRYQHQVVPEGPAEVLPDDTPGGAGQQHGVGDGADAAVDQGDVGG